MANRIKLGAYGWSQRRLPGLERALAKYRAVERIVAQRHAVERVAQRRLEALALAELTNNAKRGSVGVPDCRDLV